MDNIETYSKKFKEKITPRLNRDSNEMTVEPFRDAQVALARASFVKQDRELFFNEAYSDMLVQYFYKWLTSEPHCVKEREYLYHCALALGSVKQQLVSYETYGNNAAFFNKKQDDQEGQDE
jgi:hypothetical protein